MKNKYLKYKKEIMHHFDNGVNYIDISKILIDKFNLTVSTDHLRKQVQEVVHYVVGDESVLDECLKLNKKNQKLQDLNRMKTKVFREGTRKENALEEYNKELIKLLKNIKIHKVRLWLFKLQIHTLMSW